MHRKTRITNISHTEFGSDLLKEVGELSRNAQGATVEIQASPTKDQKGELINALLIDLAADLILALVKAAAKRLINHPLYDPLIILDLDGRTATLQELSDGD
ncbi:MAG: hypothetical protein ABJA67_14310 [Chthonomonadales bacterium]